LGTTLVSETLRQAIELRGPDTKQLLHHSDRGCQYTSDAYQTTLKTLGITCSMSRTGCCYDLCQPRRNVRGEPRTIAFSAENGFTTAARHSMTTIAPALPIVQTGFAALSYTNGQSSLALTRDVVIDYMGGANLRNVGTVTSVDLLGVILIVSVPRRSIQALTTRRNCCHLNRIV